MTRILWRDRYGTIVTRGLSCKPPVCLNGWEVFFKFCQHGIRRHRVDANLDAHTLLLFNGRLRARRLNV